MYRKIKEKEVCVLFDLDDLYKKYGPYNKDEMTPDKVRFYLDGHRTSVLRHMLYRLIGCEAFNNTCMITKSLTERDDDSYKDLANYVIEYLTSERPTDTSEHYYMKLKESKSKPNLFYLDIVLKCNFLNYIKDNPSERIKLLLQDILTILYENNITDKDIVGHYMGLCLKGTDTFEENLIKILGENNE